VSARYIWTRRLLLAGLAALVLGLSVAGLVGLVELATRGGERDAFLDSRPPPGLAQRFYPPAGWAWGLIQLGDGPAQRYGVSGPAGAPRAEVLILPD
jgi:lysophospholipase